MNRRERTRHLIELGGLVAKAGLVELTGDDRAMIYGALLALADLAAGPDRATTCELWRRRGRRAFAADQADAEASKASIPAKAETPPAGRGLSFDALRRGKP